MKSLTEYVELLIQCVAYLATSNGLKLLLAIILGVILGVIGYWLSSVVSRLWNRSYHFRGAHHIMCAIAALATLVFSVVYVSVDFMEQVARREIQKWRNGAVEDSEWNHDVFIRSFDAVTKSKLEDMSGYGNPRLDPSVMVPMNKWDTKRLVATVYSEASLEHFKMRHAYLEGALKPGTQAPEEGITQDVLDFFKNDTNASTYPLERAVKLAAGYLESQAQAQLPGVSNYTRRVTIALFVLVQLLVFAVISAAAYRSLTATV